MQPTQHRHHIAGEAIGGKVRGSRYHELTSAADAAGTADFRVYRQQPGLLPNIVMHAVGSDGFPRLTRR